MYETPAVSSPTHGLGVGCASSTVANRHLAQGVEQRYISRLTRLRELLERHQLDVLRSFEESMASCKLMSDHDSGMPKLPADQSVPLPPPLEACANLANFAGDSHELPNEGLSLRLAAGLPMSMSGDALNITDATMEARTPDVHSHACYSGSRFGTFIDTSNNPRSSETAIMAPRRSQSNDSKSSVNFMDRLKTGFSSSFEAVAEHATESVWNNERKNMLKSKTKMAWTTRSKKRDSVSENTMQRVIQKITQHPAYEASNSVLIILNAILIAWETDHTARLAKSYKPENGFHVAAHFNILSFLFCVFFTMDILLRIFAQRLMFILSTERRWNYFDVIVILFSDIEAIYVLANPGTNLFNGATLLRLLRLVRTIRLVRAVRSMAMFQELRVLVAALCGAFRSLTWTLLILVLILFMFGILFTDGAIVYMVQRNLMAAEATSNLRYFYGDLLSSMTSLFMAISGGYDWSDVLEPLSVLSVEYKLVFYMYITFSTFALLNVVNAVFVDSVMQRSQNDRDYVVATELQGKRDFMQTMDDLFDELDDNESGEISLSELQTRIQHPKVLAYFSALNLDIKQVKQLFNLIDQDKSGSIDKEEFVSGCLNLKGQAMYLDVAILQHETRSLKKLIVQLASHLDGYFKCS